VLPGPTAVEPSGLSHAESGVLHGFDRRGSSTQLDLCCALPAEEVEQQFAGSSGDAGDGFSSPRSNGVSGACPVKLESGAV
jgi:hypothetical protein